MIHLPNIEELIKLEEAVGKLKKNFPDLFQKTLNIVRLTRTLQVKYFYLGNLLKEEKSDYEKTNQMDGYILDLYKNEVNGLKNHPDFSVLKQLLLENKQIGFAKLCFLIMGKKPETLLGSSSIQ